MMKFFTRITALALAGVMSICLLTGCQTQGSSSASGSTPDSVPEVVDIATIDDICLYLTGLPSDEVVATGNGFEITAGELACLIALTCDNLSNYYYYYLGVNELPWDSTAGSGEITLADFILEDAVKAASIQHTLEAQGKQAGFVPTQENLDAIQVALDSMQAELAAEGITLQTYLFQQGLTEDLYRWLCECDYIYEALALANFGPDSSNPPTEENIRAFREAQGEYKVKHILLATVDTTTRQPLDEKTAAEKKASADTLLKALRASNDSMALFDEYMNAHSEDPGLAGNPDGYVFTANTTVDPAFEEAALALEYGQISDVVEGASGYHIILRLPLEVDVKEDTQVYISKQMSLLTEEWAAQSDYKTTKAADKLNVQVIYDRLCAYRDAVAALTAPAEDQPQEQAQ
ncbi:MAG: hypothetical protein E7440_01380 [Ruminococcaceae bacterium]|nr:hypothetical protein [Oscillospiraceae bacterium]